MLENIILIRNIFYKLFLMGLIFYVLAVVLLVFNNAWVMNTIMNTFHLAPTEINFLIAYFIGSSKMIIILFFLFPALALHWTGYNLKKAEM